MYTHYLNLEYKLRVISGKKQMSKKEAQETQLKALPEEQDKNISYSDIPPIDETKHWYKAAEHPAVYRPIKKPTTIRLDADVLEWLKSKGKGYQTRINKILREAMLDEIQR
jgi:uncharacterized protein (DUF4415 family)